MEKLEFRVFKGKKVWNSNTFYRRGPDIIKKSWNSTLLCGKAGIPRVKKSGIPGMLCYIKMSNISVPSMGRGGRSDIIFWNSPLPIDRRTGRAAVPGLSKTICTGGGCGPGCGGRYFDFSMVRGMGEGGTFCYNQNNN